MPVFIPYTVDACVRKTIGATPKGYKLTLEIFGVDYVLEFDDDQATNENNK